MITLGFNINEKTFIKDPINTDLGRNILTNSILLIDELGLEDFNFKKLSRKIQSTESSIYRYFENKHYLFIYLINWYWEWTSTRIDVAILNLTDPEMKIKNIIKTLIEASFMNVEVPFIDEEVLHRIVVREGTKAYHHKLVDDDNMYGFFLSYKSLCKKISQVFLELNRNYKYPKSLASTLIEVGNNNIYFAKHLPRLTDIEMTDDIDVMKKNLFEMLYSLVISNLKAQKTKHST